MRLLARELTRGHVVDIELVTGRGGELGRRARADGVTVHEVPWTISYDPRALWGLLRRIRAFRPAILHAHDSHALQLAAWARRLAAADAIRLCATRRVDFHVRAGGVWFQADRIIAISRAVRNVLVSDGIASDRVAVVPSGIDPDEVRRAAARPLGIRERIGVPADTPLAVNVAALVPHKDQRTLIRAALLARTECPALRWAIAGEGELRTTLAAEIRRLELEDRVYLLGYVPDGDALISEANVLVMSSSEEGLGSVVLHAMALGTPVVATRGGGLPEIVPPEWLVPVGEAQLLAQKVVAALTHAPRSTLPPHGTAAEMARGVLAVYQSLA